MLKDLQETNKGKEKENLSRENLAEKCFHQKENK